MALTIFTSFLCRRVAGLAIHMTSVSNTILLKCPSIVNHKIGPGAARFPPLGCSLNCYRRSVWQLSLSLLPYRVIRSSRGMRTGRRAYPVRSVDIETTSKLHTTSQLAGYSLRLVRERLDQQAVACFNRHVGPQAAQQVKISTAFGSANYRGRFRFLHGITLLRAIQKDSVVGVQAGGQQRTRLFLAFSLSGANQSTESFD